MINLRLVTRQTDEQCFSGSAGRYDSACEKTVTYVPDGRCNLWQVGKCLRVALEGVSSYSLCATEPLVAGQDFMAPEKQDFLPLLIEDAATETIRINLIVAIALSIRR